MACTCSTDWVRRCNLTDAGATLVGEAEKIMGAMHRAVEALAAHRGAEQGRLRIGASTAPGLYYLPRALGEFCRQFPSAEIRYVVTNSQAVERMILHNEIDLGFVGTEVTNEALKRARVARDVIVCYASADHPLAGRRRIDPRALKDELWVMREEGSATRELFMLRFAELGLGLSRVIELRDPGAVKALVVGGVGLSVASRRGLEPELERGDLVELAVTKMRLDSLDLSGAPCRQSRNTADESVRPARET